MKPGTSIFKTPEGEAEFMAAYDAALAEWPAPYSAGFVPTRYGRTHVIASGPEGAPPLVLLSGAGTSSTIWFPNVAGLSRGRRIYAVDTVGDAGKSALDRPLLTRSDCAGWLAAVFEGLSLDRADLAGISYGGWLAMNMALLAPGRVRKAVVIAPAATLAPLNLTFYKTLFTFAALPYKPVIRNVLGRLSTKKGAEFERWVEQMTLVAKHCRPKRVFPDVFPDDELHGCKTPVLMVAGENEVLYDLQAALERGKRLIPHFEAEVVPDAGHVVNIDQPGRVNARILRFLGEG